jgi:hypothetical protein
LRMHSQIMFLSLGRWEARWSSRKRLRRISEIIWFRIHKRKLCALLNTWSTAVTVMHQRDTTALKVVKRIQYIGLAFSIETWKINATKAKTQRKVIGMVATRLNSRIYFVYMQRWRENSKYLREVKNIAGKINAQLKGRVLFRYFVQLAHYSAERKRLHRNSGSILRKMLFQQVVALLRRWRFVISELRRLRLAAKKLIGRMQAVHKMSVFQSWYSNALLAGNLLSTMGKAASQMQRSLCRKCIMTWNENVRLFIRIKLVAANLAANLQRQSFIHFLSWAELRSSRKRQKQMMRLIIRRIQTRQTVAVLNEWRGSSLERHRLEYKLKKVFGRMCSLELASSMHSWVVNVSEARRLRHVIDRVAERMQGKLWCICLQTWRENMNVLKQVRQAVGKAVGRIKCQALSFSLEQWQKQLATSKKVQIVADSIIRQLHSSRAADVLCQLREVATHQRKLETTAIRVLGRTQVAVQSSMMQSWIRYIHITRRLRNVMSKATNRMQGRLWHLYIKIWHDNIKLLRRVEDKVGKTAWLKMKSVLLCCLGRWKVHCSSKKRLLRIEGCIIGRMQTRLFAIVFVNWREGAVHLHRLQIAARKVIMQMNGARLASSIHLWSFKVVVNQRLLHVLQRATSRMEDRLGSRFFAKWYDNIRFLQRYKSAIKRFLRHKHIQVFSCCIGLWTQQSATKKRMKQGVGFIIRQRQMRCTAEILFMLREHFFNLRRLERVVQKVIAHMQGSHLFLTLQLWFVNAREVRRQQHATKKNAGRMEHRLQRACLLVWHKNTLHLLRIKKIGGKSVMRLQNKALFSCLQKWANQLALKKKLQRAAVCIMQRDLLLQARTVYATWKSNVRDVRRLNNVTRKIDERIRWKRLMLMLQLWAKNVTFSISFMKQLKKCKGHILREAFVMWRENVKLSLLVKASVRCRQYQSICVWFVEFTEQCFLSKRLKRSFVSIARKMQIRCCDKVLSTWRGIVFNQCRMEKAARTVVGRFKFSCLSCYFQKWTANYMKTKRLGLWLSRVSSRMESRLQNIFFGAWLDVLKPVHSFNRSSNISSKMVLQRKCHLLVSSLGKWVVWYVSRKRYRWVAAASFWRLQMRCVLTVLAKWQTAVKTQLLLVKVGKWTVGSAHRLLLTYSMNVWDVSAKSARRSRQVGKIQSHQCSMFVSLLTKQNKRFAFSIIFRTWAAVARRIAVLKRAEHLYSLLMRLRLYKRAWVFLAIHCANEGRARVEILANRLFRKWFMRRTLSWAWENWLAGNLDGSESSYQSTRKSPAISSKIMAC